MADAYPAMRREIRDLLETTLDHLGIRPIVRVIPDNEDSFMLCSEFVKISWKECLAWRKKEGVLRFMGSTLSLSEPL